MTHIQGLLRFLPVAVVAAFLSGCAVPPGPEAYVPTETVLVGYADMDRLLSNPQVETSVGIIDSATGKDLWEGVMLDQAGLTRDDLRHPLYVFLTDWNKVTGGIVLVTENGGAARIFERVRKSFADDGKTQSTEVAGKPMLVFADEKIVFDSVTPRLILASPDILLWLFGARPEDILKGEGQNAALERFRKPATLAAVQFDPAAFGLSEKLEGLKSGVVIVTGTEHDYSIDVQGVMESPETAARQLEKLRGGLMLLSMMATQNPEAGALFRQTRVDGENNVITIRVTDAGSAINAVLKVQADHLSGPEADHGNPDGENTQPAPAESGK